MAGAAAGKYVTREEFDSVKSELQKLIIRVEVLTQDLHRLTLAVGEFGERLVAIEGSIARLEERVDRLDVRVDRIEARLDSLEKTVTDGNAALMSAILTLGRR
jgi:predicted nuclease with TOPRIM domain